MRKLVILFALLLSNLPNTRLELFSYSIRDSSFNEMVSFEVYAIEDIVYQIEYLNQKITVDNIFRMTRFSISYQDFIDNNGEITLKFYIDDVEKGRLSLLKSSKGSTLNEYSNFYYYQLEVIESNELFLMRNIDFSPGMLKLMSSYHKVDNFLDITSLRLIRQRNFESENVQGKMYLYQSDDIFTNYPYDYLNGCYVFPLIGYFKDDFLILEFENKFYYQMGTFTLLSQKADNSIESHNLYLPFNSKLHALDLFIYLENDQYAFYFPLNIDFNNLDIDFSISEKEKEQIVHTEINFI